MGSPLAADRVECPALSLSGIPCQGILSQFPDDFFVAGPDARIAFASRRRWPFDPAPGALLEDCFAAADRPRIHAALQASAAGAPVDLHGVAPRDGKERFDLRVACLHHMGAASGHVVVAHPRPGPGYGTGDAALDRMADSVLGSVGSLLKSVLDCVPVPVVATDLEDRVVLWNAAACDTLGWTEDEVIGKPSPQVPPSAEAHRRYAAARQAALSGRIGTELGAVRLTKSGRPLKMDVRMAAWRSPAHQPMGIVRALFDLRERESARQASERAARAEEAVERLQDTLQAKTTFLSSAAHELANPWSAIQVQRMLIQERLAAGEDGALRHHFEVLDRSLERMRILVEDMRVASRVERGALHVAKEVVAARPFLDGVLQEFLPLAAERGVRLSSEMGGGAAQLWVDPARLAQVLSNLLTNALRFTPAGGAVTVRLAAAERGCEISVTDTGIGIRPEDLPRLFQPFSQVHDPSLKVGGTGLGLYVSRGIVEAHGGSLSCASAGLGQGTRFVATFPSPFPAPVPPAAPSAA